RRPRRTATLQRPAHPGRREGDRAPPGRAGHAARPRGRPGTLLRQRRFSGGRGSLPGSTEPRMERPMMPATDFDGRTPQVHAEAWVAPDATVIGAVELGPDASVFYASVLRADIETIRIGARSNIQDGCVVHADPGVPVSVGAGVSVGHRAVLHGCTVEDDCLIGMGAVVLNGARIGAGSLVAAGAVVPE